MLPGVGHSKRPFQLPSERQRLTQRKIPPNRKEKKTSTQQDSYQSHFPDEETEAHGLITLSD